jgi:hypothetical protein
VGLRLHNCVRQRLLIIASKIGGVKQLLANNFIERQKVAVEETQGELAFIQ